MQHDLAIVKTAWMCNLQYSFSRRRALARLVAIAAYGAAGNNSVVAESVLDGGVSGHGGGPIFSTTGPDAERYGAAKGFPVPGYLRSTLAGNPYDPYYRVGAFSHFDEFNKTRPVKHAAEPWMFKRTQVDIRYLYRGKQSSIEEYLSRNPVMGMLIAKDSEILYEHYQYGRTDHDRFLSQSMVKSITGILIGIAVSEGAIKSVDDTAETYVPGFKGSEYGRTPIRDLLHMSSGVEFREDQTEAATSIYYGRTWSSDGASRREVRSTASNNLITGSRRRGRDFFMPA
jgi:hypothetical protein